MKIREIVTEAGLLGTLGRMAGGALKGLGQGIGDVVAPNAAGDISRSFKAAKDANTSVQKGVSKPGNLLYKGNEYTWLGQQWGLVNPATGKAVPAPKGVQQQLNYMSTRRTPSKQEIKAAQAAQTAQASQPSTVPSTILGPDGQPIQKPADTVQPIAPVAPVAPTAKTKAPAQSTTQQKIVVPTGSKSRPQTTTYQSPLGITVAQASDAGVVLKYKNTNYMLNNRGEWAKEGQDTTAATASQQMQAEMDKVAQATGHM